MSKLDEIMKVSYREFLINGYKNTSLSTIADKLNITKPALYYHFRNKKDLYLKVVEEHNKRLFKKTQLINDCDITTKEKIKNLIHQYYSVSFSDIYGDEEENYNHYYFLVDGLHHFEEVKTIVANNMNHIIEFIMDILNEGIIKGEINPDIDLEIVMFHIGVLIEGLGAVYLLSNEAINPIFERFFEHFWKYISV